jgi:hypothetical protein
MRAIPCRVKMEALFSDETEEKVQPKRPLCTTGNCNKSAINHGLCDFRTWGADEEITFLKF